MTNNEKRIMRNTTKAITTVLGTAIDMASSATDAYEGTPEGLLYERLYLAIRLIKDIPELDALRAAAIPSDLVR